MNENLNELTADELRILVEYLQVNRAWRMARDQQENATENATKATNESDRDYWQSIADHTAKLKQELIDHYARIERRLTSQYPRARKLDDEAFLGLMEEK